MPFHAAVAELELGQWLVAQGRQDDADRPLTSALETFERLRATPWIERSQAARTLARARVPA